ncbi:MAG: hypothetical protein WC919_03685 [Candidatus Paceibacterota bacterium]|jgi:bacterioferritin-associated ferredoxin
MKKIIISSLVVMVFAAAGVAANAQGLQQQTGEQTKNAGEDQQIRVEEQVQAEVQQKAGNVTEAREVIQQRVQQLEGEVQSMKGAEKEAYENQNQVRSAVFGLLAMEELAGGIGQEISQIAREINNSVQATLSAEEKIRERSALVRLFMGGEREAAQEIKQEVSQNQERIQELKQLREDCGDCSEEARALIMEQIQNIEQEQERLQQLAEEEEGSVGVFGWFRNLFRFGR